MPTLKQDLQAKILAVDALKPLPLAKRLKDFYESHAQIYQWSNKKKTIRSTERDLKQSAYPLTEFQLRSTSAATRHLASEYVGVWASRRHKLEYQVYKITHRIVDFKEVFDWNLLTVVRYSKIEDQLYRESYVKRSYESESYWEKGRYNLMWGLYLTHLQTNEEIGKIFDRSQLAPYLTDAGFDFRTNRTYCYRSNKWTFTGTIPGYATVDAVDLILRHQDTLEYLLNLRAFKAMDDFIEIRTPNTYSSFDKHKLTKAFFRKHKNDFKRGYGIYDAITKDKIFDAFNFYVPGMASLSKNIKVEHLKSPSEQIPDKIFHKYLVKNQIKILDYMDHLRLLREAVEKNIKPANVLSNAASLLPDNFQDAHLELTKLLIVEKDDKLNKTYQKFRPDLEQVFETSIDHLAFVIPKNISELTIEGEILHHCVGTYKERVVKGSSVIVFVRDVKNLDHPLYTMELNDKGLVQCRGKRNASLPENDQKIVDSYVRRLYG